jgi:hypothetical protein
MALDDVRSIVIGARRDIASVRSVAMSLAGRVAASFLPATLELAYGTRRPMGIDVYLQLRAGH